MRFLAERTSTPLNPDRARTVASALVAGQVGTVLFIFVAEGFQDVAIGDQELREFYGERLSESFGILDGHLHFHVAEIAAAEALLKAQSFAVG